MLRLLLDFPTEAFYSKEFRIFFDGEIMIFTYTMAKRPLACSRKS